MSERTVISNTCPISGSGDVEIFLEIPNVPVLCNVLYSTRQEAIDATRGDLRLGFCRESGHIYNYTFDPDRISYSQVYENSLHFSPRFQEYATTLADRLIERFDLHQKKIIEIGCGKGDFLQMLCERGDNTGIGFDPSYEPERIDDDANRRFTVIQDLYSEQYTDYEADLICCRHVLEHVEDPLDFMRTVRRAIGDNTDTAVFFEVPNVLFTLRDLAIWDLIYEHCSYFSSVSLAYLFRKAGFNVQTVADAFDGQYLTIEAYPAGGPGSRVDVELNREVLADDVSHFAQRYREKVRQWKDLLQEVEAKDQRAVIWGAGSKGVTILNVLNAQDQIEYAVDINPQKQGKYIAGTGQRIVPPDFLVECRPDLVIMMNSIYEDEIRRTVQELGIDPAFAIA